MRVVIAGAGKLGTELAEILIKEKKDIVIIEKSGKIAEELGEKLDALVLNGDASNRRIIKDADAEHCDAIVAMTGDDKTNLMICEIAKSFKIPTIVSRVNDSSNEPVFIKLGITANINTTTAAIIAFKRALEKPGKRLVNLVAGEKAEIFEMLVEKDSKIIGEKIGDISKDFVVAAIYRNGELIMPGPEKKIQDGDVIVICVPVEKVKKIESLF